MPLSGDQTFPRRSQNCRVLQNRGRLLTARMSLLFPFKPHDVKRHRIRIVADVCGISGEAGVILPYS